MLPYIHTNVKGFLVLRIPSNVAFHLLFYAILPASMPQVVQQHTLLIVSPCLSEKYMNVPEIHDIICCSKITNISSLILPDRDRNVNHLCQLPRSWLLDLLITAWMVLFVSALGHVVHISSKKRYGIMFYPAAMHVSNVWWFIPEASEPREVDTASGQTYGSFFSTVKC